VAKYPPSLQYLLMTLGPMLMVLAALDRVTQGGRLNALGRWILVFGRAPLFFYVLHIFVIHLMAVAVALMSHQSTAWLLHGAFWAAPNPPGYGHGLPFVYAVWALLIVLLYFPCAWFADIKARRKDWWLSYV
jgi:predicted acyltransferase